ncbi:MAG: protease inhibitor I42 family protein [Pseudomonadota bacterium]
MINVKWAALPLGAMMLMGCTSDRFSGDPDKPIQEQPSAMQTLENPTTGSVVTLRKGDAFALKLAANATTGYMWRLVDIDASTLSKRSEDYRTDPSPPGLVGVGGHVEFIFDTVGERRSDLVLSYQRGPDDVAERLTLTVDVGP